MKKNRKLTFRRKAKNSEFEQKFDSIFRGPINQDQIGQITELVEMAKNQKILFDRQEELDKLINEFGKFYRMLAEIKLKEEIK